MRVYTPGSTIRWACVDMSSGSCAPVMFPLNGRSRPACPSLRGVRPGGVPPLLRYYGKLRLPIARPCASLRLGRTYHLASVGSLPSAARRHRHGPGTSGAVSPYRYLGFGGDDGASQVPGEPQCGHALLFDPGGTSAPGQCGAPVWPSVVLKTSAPAMRSFRCSITRPVRSLSTLRSAGRPTPRKTRFRWVANPLRAGLDTRRAPDAISRQAPLDDSKRPGFPGAPRPDPDVRCCVGPATRDSSWG